MTERTGRRRKTSSHKRLKSRRGTKERITAILRGARQLYHFLAYAQEVGLAGITDACGVDIWNSNVPDVFAIGRDKVVFAYLDMRESQKGALDSSSNALFIRIEADVFDTDNVKVGSDYFVVCVRLTETGELEIIYKWIYEPGAPWPQDEVFMTEIYERVMGGLEILSTLRMPLVVAAA